MQLRSCSNTHFINTIKGGSVIKVHNMNSLGKSFKRLRDVYEGLVSCTSRLESASEFRNFEVKVESQDVPLAERRLHEVETPKDGAFPHGTDGDKGRDLDDSTFGDITLKELKESCKAKKRKCVQSFKHPQDQIKAELVEADPDLDEPLIRLKVKVPKAKKKCRGSSTHAVLVRCESHDLNSARQLQLQADLLLPIQVKAEVIESASEGCQNVIYADYSNTMNKKGELGAAKVMSPFLVDGQSMESNVRDKDYQSCSLNGVSSDHLENVEPLAVSIPGGEEIMDVEDQENLCRQLILLPSNDCSGGCDLDEFSGHSASHDLAAVIPWRIGYDNSGEHDVVSSDHQENVEPLAVPVPSCEEFMDEKDQKNLCRQFVLLPTSEYVVSSDHQENAEPLAVSIPSCEEFMDEKDQENSCRQIVLLPTSEYGEELQSTCHIKDKSAGSICCSRGCDLDEYSGHSTSNSAAESIAYDLSGEETYHAGDSLFQCPSSTHEKSFLSEVDRSEERQPLGCTNIDGVNRTLNNNETLSDAAEGVSTDEERQLPPAANVDDENAVRDSISYSQKFAGGEQSSSSVAAQVPERLLSTRKVVSPTSEERLSLSINSAGSCVDTDFLDCKEVLGEEKTEVRSLCEESKMQKNVSKSPQEPPAVKRIKFIISPSQNRKKTKPGRFSPPKGSLDGPRNARSLPKVNTGCTSIQGCSQNAVAFSQRQMQDIESLATKLMSELKSMKDIVEEKLLFEAYRGPSSKHDAEEVKNAITNATKTEEMAKKWLSIMGRDCNRFCKIMSQNSNAEVDSNKTLRREKRKITFADEAGGSLCHVKFFENGTTSPEPKE